MVRTETEGAVARSQKKGRYPLVVIGLSSVVRAASGQKIAASKDLWNEAFKVAEFKHSEWFALYRDDFAIDDHTWINAVNRGNFRLHPGTLSEGCITVPHNSDYALIRNALLRAAPVEVPCMKSLLARGFIEVIHNGSTCP